MGGMPETFERYAQVIAEEGLLPMNEALEEPQHLPSPIASRQRPGDFHAILHVALTWWSVEAESARPGPW